MAHNNSSLNIHAEKFLSSERPWTIPEEYDLGNATDQSIIKKKIENNDISVIHDRIDLIADNLFNVKFPNQKDEFEPRKEFVDDIIGQKEEYGRWFYFPWSQELAHYPNFEDHHLLRTARNHNLITYEEQRRLYSATIAILGMSVGSHIVENAAVSGVGGKLILADSDIIEPPNLNRLNADLTNLGSLKVDHIAKKVSKIDPYLKLVVIREDINKDSLSEVVQTHSPDIICDEIDDVAAKASVRLEAEASKIAIVMATDTGDKSLIDVERHDLEDTKLFNGRIKRKQVEALASSVNVGLTEETLRALIGIRHITPRLLDSHMEQGRSLAGYPQLVTTAAVGGALAVVASREIILGRTLNSGRYEFSFKKTLGLKSPTTMLKAIKTWTDFIKFSKI